MRQAVGTISGPAGFEGGLQHVARLIAVVRARLGLWRRRSVQRRMLAGIDDHLLRDIGLTRREAEAEARKPFWRA